MQYVCTVTFPAADSNQAPSLLSPLENSDGFEAMVCENAAHRFVEW